MLPVFAVLVLLGAGVHDLPPPLTFPLAKRPAWLRRDGIVMAGDWEPLIARARKTNGTYDATPEQLAAYKREHSEAMVRELKGLGVNFIMTHCYKGGSLEAEMPGMRDAKGLAALAHKNGMHVGVYVFSGTLLPELLNRPDWEVRDEHGTPVLYGGSVQWRHFANRNDPGFQDHLKRVVWYAVKDIKADLLHFDNYDVGPGWEASSQGRWAEWLRGVPGLGSTVVEGSEAGVTPAHRLGSDVPGLGSAAVGGLADGEDPGTSSQRIDVPGLGSQATGGSAANVTPTPDTRYPIPLPHHTWRPEWTPDTPLHREWMDFSCQSLAQSLYDMGSYARSLKPAVVLESNPGAFMRDTCPLDHGRLLRYCDALWHDVVPGRGQVAPKYIRAYKTAQAMGNMLFVYLTEPVHAAESLAFNTDCLGCIAWFEWGKVVNYPEGLGKPVSEELLKYVRFFHEKRAYYRDASRVADVAVLRSYPSQAFLPDAAYKAEGAFEDACIEARVPWAAVYGHQLGDLKRFPCVSLVGSDAMSDEQVEQVRRYVRAGGRLIRAATSATLSEKLVKRQADPFAGLPNVVTVEPGPSAIVLRQAIGDAIVDVDAPPDVAIEVTQQARRRMVHLVNYRDQPATNVRVTAQVPAGWRIAKVVLLRPEQREALSLELHQKGDRVTVTVPSLLRYALISLERGR